MLQAIWNNSWRQHPTKQQLYGHLSPIAKAIQIWRTRHAGRCWRSKDELISDILLWTPSHGRAKAGRPAKTYIQQHRADTGYSIEDIPGVMDDRDGWRERVREIRAGSATRWMLTSFWEYRIYSNLHSCPNWVCVNNQIFVIFSEKMLIVSNTRSNINMRCIVLIFSNIICLI